MTDHLAPADDRPATGPRPTTADPWPADTRTMVLDLADLVGPLEAARRSGVPAGTIRRWRHDEGRTSPAPGDAAFLDALAATLVSRASVQARRRILDALADDPDLA